MRSYFSRQGETDITRVRQRFWLTLNCDVIHHCFLLDEVFSEKIFSYAHTIVGILFQVVLLVLSFWIQIMIWQNLWEKK